MRKVPHSFEVHSNESACRKKVPLGMQQVIELFKYMLHHSLIEHVKSAGLIVSSKEIKFAFFQQTNKEKQNQGGSENKKYSRKSNRWVTSDGHDQHVCVLY